MLILFSVLVWLFLFTLTITIFIFLFNETVNSPVDLYMVNIHS